MRFLTKFMNKNKLIIFLSVGAIATLMSISGVILYKNIKMNDQQVNTQTETQINKDVNETLKNDEVLTQEEKDDMEQEDKNKYIMGESYAEFENSLKLGDAKSPEYPKEQTETFYRELCKLAETANYVDIVNKIEEKAQRYKFHEDYNWKIGNLYLDANVMIGSLTVPMEQKGYMISNLKDPYMLLIGTLMIPEEARRDVIKEVTSLSPIFDGAVNIKNTEVLDNKSDDPYVQNIYKKDSSVKEVYKINFKVENNPLIAYIVRYENGVCSFNTIVLDGNYENTYKPISYWIELDEKIKNK